MKPFLCLALLWCFVSINLILADGPADNRVENVRPIPPPGQAIADSDRAELEAGVNKLGAAIEALQENLKKKPAQLELLPDVQIFHNAVRYALTYNEIFNPTNEVRAARELLRQGLERAESLAKGEAPWTRESGLIVRGYKSKIDQSIQPYGIVIPAGFESDPKLPRRLDTWFHGRDEKLSELNFLTSRQKSPGEFVPDNAYVLHLYGRYCNANKFAGEIDLLEAMNHVKKNYCVDEDRIVARGFSMGGAACWQFAVHYPSLWVAAAPGAGFSETADFLKVFQNEKVTPPPWEQALWHWYDCTDYAANLFNCPTVAYSGELDKQKQAADVMAEALEKEGIGLTHIIGPKTGHSYEAKAKAEVNRRIDAIAWHGKSPLPKRVEFTTWTLRYNTNNWVVVEGLEKHWSRARVSAEILHDAKIVLQTTNVNELRLVIGSGLALFSYPALPTDALKEITGTEDDQVRAFSPAAMRAPEIMIDGQKLEGAKPQSDKSWETRLRKAAGKWAVVQAPAEGLKKIHGLQGPIDDAFMDSFVMVTPTGEGFSEKTSAWVAGEQKHAIEHWRKQFRGEARVFTDSDLPAAEIENSNLVLWGDPGSNKILAKILPQLPIKWNNDMLLINGIEYRPGSHMPALVFPNPLNPSKYVVLNSGFTFREYDYLNNARQIAKLPDWAVIDISEPPNARYAGKIVTAGFFDEEWKWKN
ncbi:MAG: prolyl oligopeptidase family serine peptidase [Verrucomicrobiales bacterium]